MIPGAVWLNPIELFDKPEAGHTDFRAHPDSFYHFICHMGDSARGVQPLTVNGGHADHVRISTEMYAETSDPRYPANSLPSSHGWGEKKHWMTPRHPVLTKEEVRIPAARVSREFLNSWETDSPDGILEQASTRGP
jgi:hypothetical protein